MAYKVMSKEEHYRIPGPKRILAIDGGGLRGIFSLALLKRIESMLAARHGDEFRLSHYFDLMSGTSTGSVIAASLSLGMTVDEVTAMYNDLGREVFKKSPLRWGAARAKYDTKKLVRALKDTFGADTSMGSDKIQTGLLVMTKRRDTGSPWPMSNNPAGEYYDEKPGSNYIPNKNYPLWSVVRASTAAPSYFKGETLVVAAEPGRREVKGEFVDGGVSPHNNPALQALMYATLDGHCINWPTGADNILLVSLGTGSRDPGVKSSLLEAGNAIKSLVSMMDDCNALVQTLLQWMSTSPTAGEIDSEMGDLGSDLIAPEPLLSYLRYNMELSGPVLNRELGIDLDSKTLKKLAKLDVPDNMPVLARIGTACADKFIRDEHFPREFDLTGPPAQTGLS